MGRQCCTTGWWSSVGRVKDALIHAANVLVSNQHVIHSYLLKTTTTTENVNSFTAKIRHPMSKLGPSFSTLGLERKRFHYLKNWAVVQFCCRCSDVDISAVTQLTIFPKCTCIHSLGMAFLTLMHPLKNT